MVKWTMFPRSGKSRGIARTEREVKKLACIYAVRKGHQPGIYYDAEAYQKAIDGFPGAEGHRFQDEESARRYLAGEDPVKKGIYAVRKGRVPGIYYSAAECIEQVRGFNGSESMRCSTIEEAEAYMAGLPWKKPQNAKQERQEKKQEKREERTQPEKAERSETKNSRPEKSERNGYERPARNERQERSDKSDRTDRKRGERSERPARQEWAEGGERSRGGRRYAKRKVVRVPRSRRGETSAAKHPGSRSLLVENKVSANARPVMIYTDGGCLVHEDGAGGYAAVLVLPNGNVKELSGGVDMTRSDRMEMLAAISALRTLKDFAAKGAYVQLHTDSQYLFQGAAGKVWRTWSEQDRQKVLNGDLWLELAELAEDYEINWQWVKGHNGNPINERCDWLATSAAKRTVAEKKWVPDYAAQLEKAKNRITELEKANKKMTADSERYNLLTKDRLSVSDQDLFDAIYHESLWAYLKWKFRQWRQKG